MNRETGKDRWRRVPKDYFKKSDGITKAKHWLSAVALVLAVGWWASGVDWSGGKSSITDRNGLRTNHGNVARVHVAWENKCEACHEPFKSINGQSLFSTKSVSEDSSDRLCTSCHAGPTHHEAMIKDEVQTCAGCHRDHQGRDFSLVRMKDSQCTSCHENLEAHMAQGSKVKYDKVSAFNADKGHPAFRSEHAEKVDGKLQDKSKLLFNHALHMRPGLGKEGETPRTFASILDEAERSRYQRWAKRLGRPDALNAPIELDCSSCHVLDIKDQEPTVDKAVAYNPLPSRNPGLYFLPINYQTQCRACHPLTVSPTAGLAKVEVPHGVQPDEVVTFLRRVFTEKAAGDDAGLLNRKVTGVPLAGKRPDATTALKLRDESLTKTSHALFETKTGCAECHVYKVGSGEGTLTVEPTKVPEVWYTHASFNHNAHRGADCRQCHARSYALDADGKPLKDTSIVATDVLIPGIDNCLNCHAPMKKEGGWFGPVTSTTGGVSYDCTECHRYHNGDRPDQGPAALAQDALLKRSIQDFLAGSGTGPGPCLDLDLEKTLMLRAFDSSRHQFDPTLRG